MGQVPIMALGSIQSACHNSINKCDFEMRNIFYSNMLLAGGSTRFSGMDDRIQKKVSAWLHP